MGVVQGSVARRSMGVVQGSVERRSMGLVLVVSL